MGDGDVGPTQFFYPQVTHYGTSFVGGLTVCRGFEIMQNSSTPSPSLKKTPLFFFYPIPECEQKIEIIFQSRFA